MHFWGEGILQSISLFLTQTNSLTDVITDVILKVLKILFFVTRQFFLVRPNRSIWQYPVCIVQCAPQALSF